jgi:hypothetical protein
MDVTDMSVTDMSVTDMSVTDTGVTDTGVTDIKAAISRLGWRKLAIELIARGKTKHTKKLSTLWL